MPCAVIVQVFIGLADFFAGVDIPATDHPEATLPTFDQPPQQVAARTRPIHFLGDRRIALQLALGLLKHLLGEESWRLTPDPLGIRAITPAGGERVQLGFLLLPIAREGRLTIVVARLAGIDAVGEDI